MYISCKATSLARDLEMIQARGYRVVKCTAVDQFCQTVHVETVCLQKKKAPVYAGLRALLRETYLQNKPKKYVCVMENRTRV